MSNNVANQNYNSIIYGAGQKKSTPAQPDLQVQTTQSNPPQQQLQTDSVSFGEAKQKEKKGPNGFVVGTAIAIPTYFCLYAATDYMNSKMRGSYDQTMLGKLAKFGNAIEENKYYKRRN